MNASASVSSLPSYFGAFMAFFIVLALIPILRRFAPKVGLVDHPGGRKKHAAPVPLVGGVAIYMAVLATVLFTDAVYGFQGLFLGSSLLFFLGLIDDRFDVNAKVRFILQAVIVSGALYLDDVWIRSIGNIYGSELHLGLAAYPLTVVAILGVTNAINMLDGLDGLASGVMMMTLSFILGVASLHNPHIEEFATVALGALVGFWLYNYRFPWRERASVFMGDSGTMFLGFLLPYLAIYLTSPTHSSKTIEPAYLLWLFALPLWDITTVILKRIKDGRSPLSAGRDHIHHILLNQGFSVQQAVLFIYGIAALSLSLGTSLLYFGFGAMGLIISFCFALYFYVERLFKHDKRPMADLIEIKSKEENKVKTFITKV